MRSFCCSARRSLRPTSGPFSTVPPSVLLAPQDWPGWCRARLHRTENKGPERACGSETRTGECPPCRVRWFLPVCFRGTDQVCPAAGSGARRYRAPSHRPDRQECLSYSEVGRGVGQGYVASGAGGRRFESHLPLIRWGSSSADRAPNVPWPPVPVQQQ